MKNSELVRLIERAGWICVRRSCGGHMIYQNPQTGKIMSVPDHPSKEVGKGLAHKLLKKLKGE